MDHTDVRKIFISNRKQSVKKKTNAQGKYIAI